MVAELLVEVCCPVCRGEADAVICTARQVRAEMEYLDHFHRRRLRPCRTEEPAAALTDRAVFTQTYAADIVACDECRSLFRSPRPTSEAILRAYVEDGYGYRRLLAMFEAQRALTRRKARMLCRWLGAAGGGGPPARPRVVEVGSFVGGFLTAGQERGWEMLGVDPGEEVTEFCARRGLPVFRGTIDAAPVKPGSVDCVAIWNTFDQLAEPAAALTAVRSLLRPGGLLAIRVPNGECFRRLIELRRRLPKSARRSLRAVMAWNNLLAFPYLHGYTAPSLDRLLAQHGFARIAVHPDTLLRLSDRETRTWAACEEAVLKLLCRAAARTASLRPDRELALAPWFDAYYRLDATTGSVPISWRRT